MKTLFLHLFFFFLLALPSAAFARNYDLYRADYPKGAFCSAIGGACAADHDLENAFFQNPAAITNGEPDWNFDGDFTSKDNLERGLSRAAETEESTADGGFAYSAGNWGIGISFQYSLDQVSSPITIYDDASTPQSGQVEVRAKTLTVRLPVSLLLTPKLSLGAAVSARMHYQSGNLNISPAEGGAKTKGYAPSFAIGTIYSPHPNLHFGSWFSTPSAINESLTFAVVAAPENFTYREDFSLNYPWIWANGFEVDLASRTQIFAESDLIGPVSNAYLLSYSALNSTDTENGLHAKGVTVTVEPHLGVRQALNDELMLHLGSFYEDARTVGTHGRLHKTGGLSYKLNSWIEFIGGFDVAHHYSKFFISFR